MPEQSLREFEANAVSGEETTFRSNVSGKKSGPKKNLKKKAPLFALGLLAVVGGALIFVSQSLMPFAIVNRFIEEFNTLGISSTLRADNILDYQLEFSGGFFSLSENQRSAFKEEGIEAVDFTLNSSRSTALIFEDKSKKLTPVVSKNVLEKSSESEIISALRTSNSNLSDLSSPVSVSTALENMDFKEKYANASKLYRGGNSGWYDTIENLTEARLSISRNRYANWATYAFSSGEKEAFKKLASSKSVTDGGISDYGTYSETDEDGNTTTSGTNGTVDSESLTSATTADGVRAALNSKIASVAKLTATAGCAGVEILSAIQTVVSVQQAVQYMNVASGYLEAVQKTQAGYGSESPLNDYVERLTTENPETKKSAMTDGGIPSLFDGPVPKASDDSVKITNFESLGTALGSLTGDLAFTAKAFETCSYIRMGVSGVNFATTILNFVPVIGQSVTAVHIVAKVVGKLALGVAVGEIISFIVPKILTSVVKIVTEDVATEWTGGELSNGLYSGAHKIFAGNFQTGGGSGASKEKLLAYRKAEAVVLAENAELERREKSPFDLSSKNTFFGSLAYSLIPFASSLSVNNAVKSFGDLVRSSSLNLLPTASALDDTELVGSVGNCPFEESVGAVSDFNCDPYYITDESTISLSPLEVIKKANELDSNNFSVYSENGKVEINPNSNLGKYIKYCGQRNSTLGIADANIASDIAQRPNSLVANLPLVGDVASLISAATEAENMPWISGSACIASEENSLWEENKIYQRFAEDQRLFESAGIVEKSAVTAMLEDYYEENPLDNSRAGIIARFSGMEKEKVVAVLDVIDGLTYLAEYNPSERFDFLGSASVPEIRKISASLETSKTVENRLYLFYDKLLQPVRKRNLSVAEG